MFSTQRFPSANNKWEDKDPAEKNMVGVEDALQIIKKKAYLSRASLGTQDQFGTAHGAGLLTLPNAPLPALD